MRLNIPALLILLDGNFPCGLQDLSQTGARLRLDGYAARPGQEGVLTVCGHDVFGTVVWARMGMLGLRFDEVLAMPTIVEIRNFSDGYRAHDRAQSLRAARDFVQGRQTRC